MVENSFSIKKRAKSFVYAFRGIVMLIRGEHNAWIHSFAAVAVVVAGFSLDISPYEWIAVVFAIGAVVATEAFNTAIEKLANKVCCEHDALIGAAKDLAAGGVLIVAITASIVGLIIFIPKIIAILC